MTADGAPSPPPSCPVSVSEPFNLITAVDAAPGRLTNAYEVQKPVGKGGYAIVHRGIRRSDGRVVAVKKVEVRGHTACSALSQRRQLPSPCGPMCTATSM